MAGSLGAALGPAGGLAACACCLLICAIWGLFATTIALAVYTKRWKEAILEAGSGTTTSGADQMFFSQALLIGILAIYGFIGLRRALRSVQ